MMNNVMLVGRLVKTPDLFSTENGHKGSFITIAVNRPYKNVDGEYETDYLDCTLWAGIAENAAEYCKKGDTIGVRGKLPTRILDNEDGTKSKKMEIIADRISFISSKQNNSNAPEVIEQNNCDEEGNEIELTSKSNETATNKQNKKKNNGKE